ncbi:MAG: thioredoxin family protein [Flavobacteriales bacterium]|jgi:thioredoxin-related protein|nr:thioredoxin family protein [Flavobacteriales bacterium]MCB0758831.1 thioredoxin family protein [Flavobacteriales bacterium]
MRTLFFSLCLAPLTLFAQEPATGGVHWSDIETAQKAAKKDGKPLLIDVYTSWCGPCRMLDKNTFQEARTAAYINEHFHPVKFNAEGGETVIYNGKSYSNPSFDPAKTAGRNGTHDLTMAIAPMNGRIAYPTIVYMDKDGNVLAPVQGYMSPEQIEPILTYFGEGFYMKQEFPEFQKNFVSKRK